MAGTEVIQWELIAVIITLLGGFGTIAFMLGKRNTDIDNLQGDTNENKTIIQKHLEDCVEKREEISEKLAEGSTKFALIEQGQKTMQSDINTIKEWLRPKID